MKYNQPEQLEDSSYLTTSESAILTAIGKGTVEIYTQVENNEVAREFINKVLAEIDFTAATLIVYENYHNVERFPEWMRECEVPINLRYDQIGSYITNIALRGYWTDGDNGRIVLYIRPLWDIEHCIYLEWDSARKWLKVDC